MRFCTMNGWMVLVLDLIVEEAVVVTMVVAKEELQRGWLKIE